MGTPDLTTIPRPAYRVQVLDRAFRILDTLSEQGPELGVAELAARVQLHKSTVHRLLMVLERNRFVEKAPGSGKYRLGSRLFELGMRAATSFGLPDKARPYLEWLALGTGETAHLGVLRDGEVISVANAEGSHTLRTPSTVGRRSPAHCTSLGKSILAWLPGEELERLVRKTGLRAFTRHTVTRLPALKAELQRVREQGYAVDNEEVEEGLKCIGAPVWDHLGKVVAAISIAGPAARLGVSRMPALTASVRRAAAQLSTALGYRDPHSGGANIEPGAFGRITGTRG